MLAREPAPLGAALGDVLRGDGIELVLGAKATAARREGEDYVLELDNRDEVRGDRLLLATGRRPRVSGFGLETVGAEANAHGIRVDDHLRAGERLWAIGDVTGILPLTHVGEYQGEVVASNILGEPRTANYEAVPRVTYTDPQAAAVGAAEDRFVGTAALSEIPKTATYTHAYAESNGFLTLTSDGERLTGAYALGPEAGEWLQQATLAIRARVPLELLGDLRRGAEGAPPRDRRRAPACRCGIVMTEPIRPPTLTMGRLMSRGKRLSPQLELVGQTKEEDVEFLVEFEIKIPEGTPESEVKDREDAEADAAAKLVEEGHLVRVWKLPVEAGETQILGLYRADSETELDGLLRALPLYEWMRVSVTPLALHPNDPARSQLTDGNRA